jgi:solute carrier family 35 protein E3
MSIYKFNFPTSLTAYHFFLTLILLETMTKLKIIHATDAIPSSSLWWMGFFGVVSIVTMNYSLKINSIGFYQLSKLCTIPCMVVYKLVRHSERTPLNTIGSLGLLLVGLCLFTVNDVQFNILGSLIAVIAVLTTTIYQTQTNVYQKAHHVTGIQLNHAVSLARCVQALIASVFIDGFGAQSILKHDFQAVEVGLILFTGFLAVMGNCVGFSLIGRAGQITFQVVGHVKTMTVFIFGLLMFPTAEEPPQKRIKKIAGLCVSMVGVILYTVFEIRNKEQEKGATGVAPAVVPVADLTPGLAIKPAFPASQALEGGSGSA